MRTRCHGDGEKHLTHFSPAVQSVRHGPQTSRSIGRAIYHVRAVLIICLSLCIPNPSTAIWTSSKTFASEKVAIHCYEALIGSEFERTHGWHVNLMPESGLHELPAGWKKRGDAKTNRQIKSARPRVRRFARAQTQTQ